MNFQFRTTLALMLIALFSHMGIGQNKNVELSKAVHLGKIESLQSFSSKASKSAIEIKTAFKENRVKNIPNFFGAENSGSLNEDGLPKYGDDLASLPIVNNRMMLTPQLNYDGINQDESGSIPPDTNGEIGKNHYIQTTNGGGGSLMEVYDKEGNSLTGPIQTAAFWTDFGVNAIGDPVIMYDQFNDRWIFTEVVAFGPNALLIAYSETSDPLGAWNSYIFFTPDLPDYPKYGIWEDKLICTTNEPSQSDIPVYVLNLNQLTTAQENIDIVRIASIPKFNDPIGSIFQVATPADMDGNSFSKYSSNPIVMRMHDDSWGFGDDRLELWEVNVNWASPMSSSVDLIAELTTEPFESQLCQNNIFECINQPNNVKTSALQHVLMYRVQYRQFSTYESMICTHSVDVAGNDVAGVRWYEMRKPENEDWSIYQQGTLGDGVDSRFMASIGMNGKGSIALGYSITGDSKFLSGMITGRTIDDPVGTLTFDETEIAPGLSLNFNQRWGDYSAMSVDPVDQNTFWYTTEFMDTNNEWATKITKFVLDSRDSIDIAPTRLIAPDKIGFFTNEEYLTLQLTNHGFSDVDSFQVGYSVTNGNTSTENYTTLIKSDSTQLFTFQTPIDLSAKGKHYFKCWTSLDTDQNTSNDTLFTSIENVIGLDVGISNLTNIQNLICSTEKEIGIEIRNNGLFEITTADIYIQLNSNTPDTLLWTGSLGSSQLDTINYLFTDFIEGTNTLSITTNNPNQGSDEDPSNDNLTRTIVSEPDSPELTIRINTDDYPQETSWILTDDSGATILTSPAYTEMTTLYELTTCLAEGCYQFTIFDAANDGLCCFYGLGNYELVNDSGQTVAMGAEFGGQEITNFCLPFECQIDATVTLGEAASSENAQDGSIGVNVQNGAEPYDFSIDGNPGQSNPQFTNLGAGAHQLIVTDANNCMDTIDFIMPYCQLSATIDILNAPTNSNSSDGSISINAVDEIISAVYSIGGPFQPGNTFTGLDDGPYTISVRDQGGCVYTEDIFLDPITSVENIDINQIDVTLSPVPVKDLVTIRIEGLTDVYALQYKVYSLDGREIYKGAIGSFNNVMKGKIPMVIFPSAVYFVKFDHPEMTKFYKIIKQ